MNHGDHIVEIIDDQGNVIGALPRKEIDKEKDSFRAAYIIIHDDSSRIGLTRIPEKGEFGTKELYGGKWGCSSATILRKGESPEDAAKRALKYDFQIDDAPVELLGETFETFDDGMKRDLAIFKIKLPKIDSLSYITNDELDQWIREEPEKISPTLLVSWQRYKDSI